MVKFCLDGITPEVVKQYMCCEQPKISASIVDDAHKCAFNVYYTSSCSCLNCYKSEMQLRYIACKPIQIVVSHGRAEAHEL